MRGQRWFRWGELSQLHGISPHEGIAVAVEPGAWVEIVAPGPKLDDGSPMGVTHYEQVHRGLRRQLSLGPGALPRRRQFYPGSVKTVLSQHCGKPMDQWEAQLRMQRPVNHRCCSTGHHPLQHSSQRARTAEPVAMDRKPTAPAGLELEPMRSVADAGFTVPELESPSIVIAANHQDRHLSRKSGERRGRPEGVPGDDGTIGEPEFEQVAVYEQRVAQ